VTPKQVIYWANCVTRRRRRRRKIYWRRCVQFHNMKSQ